MSTLAMAISTTTILPMAFLARSILTMAIFGKTIGKVSLHYFWVGSLLDFYIFTQAVYSDLGQAIYSDFGQAVCSNFGAGSLRYGNFWLGQWREGHDFSRAD
jgi:hypothetical protein